MGGNLLPFKYKNITIISDMKFILGYKKEMTQTYREDKVLPITIVKIDPCKVTQAKTEETDGYSSVQIGCGSRKNMKKPLKGHLKGGHEKYIKEFRVDSSNFKVGDVLDIESFQIGDKVDVVATSKGKGFQGVVRRHGFAGQSTSHGTKDQVRMPGSIGATGPAHVFKGVRMPGQMGNIQTTTKNLEIIEIDIENSLLKLKGAVPGHRNSLVMIKGDGEMKVLEIKKQEKEEVKKDEAKESKGEEKEDNKESVEKKEKEEVKEESKKDEVSGEAK